MGRCERICSARTRGSVTDFGTARGLTFFDRGVVDAAVALASTGGEDSVTTVARLRYDRFFLAPPWPEIYEADEDRRHSLKKALSDYERVRQFYLNADYVPVTIPRETVQARADFVISELGI